MITSPSSSPPAPSPVPSFAPAPLDAATTAALERGARALTRIAHALPPGDPFAGVVCLATRADAAPLLAYWRSRAPGSPTSEMRYRWELSHRHARPFPPYAPDPECEWTAWRAAERSMLVRDPYAFEERLAVPVVLADHAELLDRTAEDLAAPTETRALAADLLREALPVMRRDFARHVQAIHAWEDTFALWCLARRPRALARLHPLAVAIATCYAAVASESGGVVRGTRFPLHDKPLSSASAQLAAGLLALGTELELVAQLVAFVRDAGGRAEQELAGTSDPGAGGWGDAGGAPDVLTTLVCAELLAQVDPSYDPGPTVRFLASCAHPEHGVWRAIGPDAPWLTAEVLAFARAAAERPFAARFRWPFLAAANRDHKTALPFYAYFADLARLFAALPGLSAAPCELAFVDLAGFRAFNNRFGQDRGDAVLAEFARALSEVPSARAVRDGGDEFLLVGAPTRAHLARDLDALRRAWPARFARAFGADVPPVAPRILVRRTRGALIAPAREQLGREITGLKDLGTPGPEGVLREADA